MFHKHLIVRAEVTNPLVGEEATKDWLRRIVEAIGMKITKSGGPHVDYVDQPDNAGIAGIVMIETSHVSVHVWDKIEKPVVHFDVYSCSDFDVDKVLEFLNEMKPTSVRYNLLDRNCWWHFKMVG